ncbi:hypothetical protein H257_09100 [Aphanomyces astaci]|uniref:Reverse transcriptase RNase H-like domain-containing protein n=1 Tax=Aphanomyces astaci TaxID=112090 RepID=W4GE34_APHAT|nr:hypothetical protein H257_09100 [Aphanomyces astaci]ETV77213.1 hypothetical protein H257_09100 [Aphanomyces astaci]|eukprot:XP_009833519.1 hypothetical protein H257_09100 [Aphanomyces astaci]
MSTKSCRSINVLSEPPLAAALAHGIWSLVGHKDTALQVTGCGSFAAVEALGMENPSLPPDELACMIASGGKQLTNPNAQCALLIPHGYSARRRQPPRYTHPSWELPKITPAAALHPSLTGTPQADTSRQTHSRRSPSGPPNRFNPWRLMPAFPPRSKLECGGKRSLPVGARRPTKDTLEMSFHSLVESLGAHEIAALVMHIVEEEMDLFSTSTADESVLDAPLKSQTRDSLRSNPYYDLLKEFDDVFPDEVPCRLPIDKGVQHEVDLVPGAKYCVGNGHYLATKSTPSMHSSRPARRRKPGEKSRIVHAFNKLNVATIPGQTPMHHKDVIMDGTGRSTIFSTIDLRDGFYQILMRHATGSMQRPGDVQPHVTAKFRAFRAFAPSYFDDIYAELDVLYGHVRRVFEVLCANGLYANLAKCMFGVDEIPVLGDLVGMIFVAGWALRRTSTSTRKHRPAVFRLLVKDAPWVWNSACQSAFEGLKTNLQLAPVLVLADFDKSFSVVCDTSQFANGYCFMQLETSGHPRPDSYQSRQLHPAERAYPVHNLELLSMKYALTKFRIYLLDGEPFVVYTDHASLRTATNTPHLSQRLARWISFFFEFTFSVQYKPGKDNILADALSRRPNFKRTTIGLWMSGLHDRIRAVYPFDADCSSRLAALTDPVST